MGFPVCPEDTLVHFFAFLAKSAVLTFLAKSRKIEPA